MSAKDTPHEKLTEELDSLRRQVAELKAAEVERQRAEEEAQQMVLFHELNPSPVLRFDTDGKVLVANRAAREILGSALEGRALSSILPGVEGFDPAACIRDDAIPSHSTQIGDRFFHFVCRGVSELGVGHIYGTDVTEMKRAEEALRASTERFAGILDIAHDAVISVDDAQHIALFNQGAENVFGYRAEEIIGKRLDMLLPQRLVEAHRAHVQEFAASPVAVRRMGERGNVLIFGRRKDGTEFPAEASISKLELNGEKLFTAMLRDITERKRAEDVLQQKVQELTALNKMFQSHLSERLKVESAYYRLSTTMVRLSEDIQNLAKQAEAWKAQVEQVLVKEGEEG